MKIKIYLLTVFLSTVLITFGQQKTKEYNDNFGIKGYIKYFGDWSDTSLPKQGLFDLKWRTIDSLKLTTLASKGYLKNHLPYGNWNWEEATWEYSIEPGTQISPHFKTKGERIFWKGMFTNGMPNGKWKMIVDSVIDTKVTNAFVEAEINYKNGIPFGNFYIKKQTNTTIYSVSGTCNNNGIANGTWIFEWQNINTKKTIIEERTYKNGILIEQKTIKDGKTTTLTFHENIEYLAKINETKSATVQLSVANYIDDGIPFFTENNYNQFAIKYLNSGWKLAIIQYNFGKKLPQFKRIEFPLNETEKNTINELKIAVSKTLNNALEYQKNTSLTINRGRSEMLDEAMGFIDKVIIRMLLYDSIITTINEEKFILKDRQKLFLNDAVFTKNNAHCIEGHYYSIDKTITIPSQIRTSLSYIDNLYLLHNEIDALMKFYTNEIEKNLEEIKLKTELLNIEQKLFQKLQNLDSLFGQSNSIVSYIHNYWINGHINKRLQQYAQEDNYSSAKIMAYSIQSKMDSLIIWHKTFPIFDTLPISILNQYTNYVYNPYSGKNDIEMRLKKRFYNSINLYVIPYIINGFYEAQNWSDFADHYRSSIRAYNDIMSFVNFDDKSSKKVEKKIRQTQNPERIIKILHHYMEESEL